MKKNSISESGIRQKSDKKRGNAEEPILYRVSSIPSALCLYDNDISGSGVFCNLLQTLDFFLAGDGMAKAFQAFFTDSEGAVLDQLVANRGIKVFCNIADRIFVMLRFFRETYGPDFIELMVFLKPGQVGNDVVIGVGT